MINNKLTNMLLTYQRKISDEIFNSVSGAFNLNEKRCNILNAVTGAGKTVILTRILDLIINSNLGKNKDICFFWVSNDPNLNEQSRDKITLHCNTLENNLIILDNSNYHENLIDKNIYFLNYQKLNDSSQMVQKRADSNNKSFFDLDFSSKNIILIIDEAHQGSGEDKNKDTKLRKIINTLNPIAIIGASATSNQFQQLISNEYPNYKLTINEVDINDVKDSGIIKQKLINVTLDESSSTEEIINRSLFKSAINHYIDVCNLWKNIIKTEKNPVFLIQVEKEFNEDKESISDLLECLFIDTNNPEYINQNFIYNSFGEGVNLNWNDRKGNTYQIPYIEPNKISDNEMNKTARIILFKESLSEGWDCPNAEVLFSIKTQKKDSTITQILGRIIRNPFVGTNILDNQSNEIKDKINTVKFYTPNFDANVLKSIVKAFGTDVGHEHVNGSSKKVVLRKEVLDFFNTNKVTHLRDRFSKKSLADKISEFININDNWTQYLEEFLKLELSNITLTKEILIESLHTNIKEYNINVGEKFDKKKNSKETEDLSKNSMTDIINSVQYSFRECEDIISIFESNWIDETSYHNFYEINLKMPKIKDLIKEIIKEQKLKGIDFDADGYKLILLAINKTTNLEKNLLTTLMMAMPEQLNEEILFIPHHEERFIESSYNKLEIKDISKKLINGSGNEEKHNFLVTDNRSAFFDEDDKIYKQAMSLNDLEITFLKNYIAKHDFDYWWRNPTNLNGLGIKYDASENQIEDWHIFRPDFLAIKNNELYILEPKAKIFGWKNKYIGLINWATKQGIKIHYVWFFKCEKDKQYYLVQDATKKLLTDMENKTFAELEKLTNNIINPIGGIVQKLKITEK